MKKPNLPMLVMEYLPFNLTHCLEKYDNIPLETKYHILLGVSIGLRFLHEQNPPIIHRDLTTNNVMLTVGMKSKITDLGQARITDVKATEMTPSPGISCYMPPEARANAPVYNESLDVFSFGVLIVHTVTQKWPIPASVMPTDYIQRTEVDTRRVYFKQMEESNVLTSLAKKCLSDDPKFRPHLSSITDDLQQLVTLQSHSICIGSLEAVRIIKEMKSRISVLELSIENACSGIDILLQDIKSKELITDSEIFTVLKHLVSISQALLVSQGESQNQLAVAYRSTKHKGCAIQEVKLTLPDNEFETIIQPSINFNFTSTTYDVIKAELKQPVSVAVSKEGLVYICDELGWSAVHIFNSESKEVVAQMINSTSQFKHASSVSDEECWHPSGIAIDQDSNILLSDTGSHRILKFSPNGKLLAKAGTKFKKGREQGEFNRPKGIAVASNGYIFVCDCDNHRIQILTTDLSIVGQAYYGAWPVQLHYPYDIAFDSNDNIYVVDNSNYCVKVFTMEFNFLHQIGVKGHEYQAPRNICIDCNDYVYVTDEEKNRVVVFNQAREVMMHFGGHEKHMSGLNHPLGIAADMLGFIYVCDSYNKCVQIFV